MYMQQGDLDAAQKSKIMMEEAQRQDKKLRDHDDEKLKKKSKNGKQAGNKLKRLYTMIENELVNNTIIFLNTIY